MKRQIRIDGDLAYVPLTRGYVAVIDAADVPLVDGCNWFTHVKKRADGSIRGAYAVRMAPRTGPPPRFIYMHRLICGTPDGFETDHIDGDSMNNRRSNLRPASAMQNRHNQGNRVDNKSGYKGVCWAASRGKWQAKIGVAGKQKHLGRFESAEDAHAAYCKASAELHGEFGRTE